MARPIPFLHPPVKLTACRPACPAAGAWVEGAPLPGKSGGPGRECGDGRASCATRDVGDEGNEGNEGSAEIIKEKCMSIPSRSVRVWSQPIRDRQCRLAGYELLHREAGAAVARVTDDAVATDDVIRLVYGAGEARRMLAAMPGFVNVDAEMLLSPRIESLPKGEVMLELLETVAVDEQIIRRCRELKSLGYRLALDDFCEFRGDLLPLLELVDLIKVDVSLVEDGKLAELVERLRLFPLQLLAEKVDSRACAQRCQALCFDFFQGYYFDLPAPTAGQPH